MDEPTRPRLRIDTDARNRDCRTAALIHPHITPTSRLRMEQS